MAPCPFLLKHSLRHCRILNRCSSPTQKRIHITLRVDSQRKLVGPRNPIPCILVPDSNGRNSSSAKKRALHNCRFPNVSRAIHYAAICIELPMLFVYIQSWHFFMCLKTLQHPTSAEPKRPRSRIWYESSRCICIILSSFTVLGPTKACVRLIAFL
jgi:hypothetical protein